MADRHEARVERDQRTLKVCNTLVASIQYPLMALKLRDLRMNLMLDLTVAVLFSKQWSPEIAALG